MDKSKAHPLTPESFEAIIENSLTGVYIIQSGQFQFVNSRMAEILGFDQPQDLIGKDFLEIIHPDDSEMVRDREFQRETTPVTPSHYCYRGMKTDGTLVWLEMSGTTASYRSKPANIGNIIDITSRKNAEDKWQESEQKYLSLLDDIDGGYFENDLQGILSFVNDSYCRIFGYEKQELIGTSFRRLVSDDASADEIYEDYNQMYTTGDPLKGKAYSFLTKDGLVKHIEIRSSLNISPKGKPIGFKGIVRDVTDKTMATQALQESEEKYRTILETIEDGYIEVDITGTTTFCNEKTCQIFGYPRQEFMGMNNRQYMDEESARHVYKAFNKVYRTGNPERGVVYDIIRKDQNKRIVEINVSPRKNKTGDVEGFNGIVRDITDRVKSI
jgi:PAS domain S-box-containing protein